MEGYVIYIIIGIIVAVIAAAGLWWYFYKNQSKQLREELFEGEAYCLVEQKLREGSSVIGKRKY
jgi:flagellar basal body-associated protein FliL